MLPTRQVEADLDDYRDRLEILATQYLTGERGKIVAETVACTDALTCLLDETYPEYRERIAYLIARYEALRASCAN